MQQRTIIMAVQYFLFQLTDGVSATTKPGSHTAVRSACPITEFSQGTVEILFKFFSILFPSLLKTNV